MAEDDEQSQEDLEAAEEALRDFADGPAREAAETIKSVFEETFEVVHQSIVSAARAGELEFDRMAQHILETLAALAIEEVVHRSFSEAVDVLLPRSAPSPRADGGPVVPGSTYLVGERGPELFTPASAGSIGSAGGVTVNLTLNTMGGAGEIERAMPQLETSLARAVARGQRNL